MGIKLVRDKLRDIPWGDEDAKKYLREVTGPDEHLRLLRAKLLEEIGELFAAIDDRNRDGISEEIGDVMSVVVSLGALLETDNYSLIDLDTVMNKAEEKDEERGSFFEGLVWDRSSYMGD